MNIGEKIRDARKKQNWSQTVLAGKIGVTLQTISRWEKGDREPKASEVRSLAKSLEISVSDLLEENNLPYSSDNPEKVHKEEDKRRKSEKDFEILLKMLAAEDPDLILLFRSFAQNIDKICKKDKEFMATLFKATLERIDMGPYVP